MTDQKTPELFRDHLRKHRRWGRWGDDDQIGAVNLITPGKILSAIAEVKTGEAFSLSRRIPTEPAVNNPKPADHFMLARSRGSVGEGSAVDYLGISYHGRASTHLDGLCHLWNGDGMWNGRDPEEEITYEGVRWCGVEGFKNGIITRGVLVDVAAHREERFVDVGKPVTGDELRGVAEKSGLRIEPGDAVVVHSGRENWERHSGRPWGGPLPDGSYLTPGLDETCLDFFYETDPALIVWDMMDAAPNDWGVPHLVHSVLFSQGIPLLDNALLDGLSARCAAAARTSFLLLVAPLLLEGGTGSPVNPIAVF